jgi:hypothetical protein
MRFFFQQINLRNQVFSKNLVSGGRINLEKVASLIYLSECFTPTTGLTVCLRRLKNRKISFFKNPVAAEKKS